MEFQKEKMIEDFNENFNAALLMSGKFKGELREVIKELIVDNKDNVPFNYINTITTKDGKNLIMMVSSEKRPESYTYAHNLCELMLIGGHVLRVNSINSNASVEFESTDFNFSQECIGELTASEFKIQLAIRLMHHINIYRKFNGNLMELLESDYLKDENLFIEDFNGYTEYTNINNFLAVYNKTVKNLYRFKSHKRPFDGISKDFIGMNYLYSKFNNRYGSPMKYKFLKYRWVSTLVRGKEVIMYSLDKESSRDINRASNNNFNDDEKLFNVSCIKMDTEEEARLLSMMLELYVDANIIELVFHIKKLIDNNANLYTYHKINTPSKVREIYAPEDKLKAISKNMLFTLTNVLGRKFINPQEVNHNSVRKPNDFQYAYRSGLSIKDNAIKHQPNKYLVKFDIENFFDDCSWEFVARQVKTYYTPFKTFKCNNLDLNLCCHSVYKLIESALQLLIINPATQGIYQGNPLSGFLSNAIMNPAANHLNNLFNKDGITFSLYSDDVTISSNKRINVKSALGKINYIFDYYNLPFKLKNKKTIRGSNNRRSVTGVTINHNDELTIRRDRFNLIKSILFNLKVGKEVTYTIPQIRGLIAFCKFIDESGKVDRILEKYKDVVINQLGLKSFFEDGEENTNEIIPSEISDEIMYQFNELEEGLN